MNIEKILSQLKNIEPDPTFSRISKAEILSAERSLERPMGFMTFLKTYPARFAVLAVSAAVIIVALSASLMSLSPKSAVTSLDPGSLRAEAEAIDIQIQLMNLTYREPSIGTTSESTAIIAPPSIKKEVEQQAESLGLKGPASSTNADSPSTINVDEALEKLSK